MRVLVAEDARPLAEVLAEGLRDQGMAVDVALDGLSAAAKLDINSYDVVVLDRDLPGIHGDTLCQMITSRDRPGDGAHADRGGTARATGSAGSGSAPTTTSPSRSISPSSSCASGRSRGGSPRPGR